ncbi:MAG: SHOCT domain-containing protein [Carnobacterium sp.]
MYDCFNLINKGSRSGLMMFNRGGGSNFMMFMGVFWIAVLVIILLFAVKFFNTKQTVATDRETPLEVLQKEYAKGTISESDYLERKGHL